MISLGLSNFRANASSPAPAEALRALGETAAWFSQHQLRAKDLRSAILDPSSILAVPSLNELGIDQYSEAKRDSYRQASESIRQKRSRILRDTAIEPISPAEAQALGRLLLYDARETVSDGAAEALSNGFFDVEDAPPWDTWFWYEDGTIFCWVPDSLVPYAQAGIDVNPVNCIRWAKWSALSALISR